MSSSSFDSTIDLTPRASIRALSILMVLHGLAGFLLMFAQPPQPVMFLGLGIILFSWIRVRRHATFGFGPRALARLTWHADGHWTLHDAGGTSVDATLEGDSLLWPGLVLLNFRTAAGERASRALLGDEVDPDAMSALRARLGVRRT